MPSLEIGDTTPSGIYLGNTQINRIYHGRQIVWPESDASGPRGCWVPLLNTQTGQVVTGHPEQCRNDLGLIGEYTLFDDFPATSGEYGFNELVHSGDFGKVPTPTPAFANESTTVRMTTLHGIIGSDAGVDNLDVRFRSGDTLAGQVVGLSADFRSNGYLMIYGPSAFNPTLVILKASYGSQSAGTTLSYSSAQLAENDEALGINMITPPLVNHQSGVPYLTSNLEFDYRVPRAVGYLTDIDAIEHFHYVEEYQQNHDDPVANIFYGAPWSTYGTGESARFLSGVRTNGSTNNYIYDSNNGNGVEHVTGTNVVDSSFSIGRIRYTPSNRRLILNKTGDSSVNMTTFANNAGANKSLYVLCRGDMLELNFNFNQGFTGSDLPDYEIPVFTGNGWARWNLADTDNADAMHDHLVDYSNGNGYQVLFVVANSGTILPV